MPLPSGVAAADVVVPRGSFPGYKLQGIDMLASAAVVLPAAVDSTAAEVEVVEWNAAAWLAEIDSSAALEAVGKVAVVLERSQVETRQDSMCQRSKESMGRAWEFEEGAAFGEADIADRAALEAVRSCSKMNRRSEQVTVGNRPYWTLAGGLVQGSLVVSEALAGLDSRYCSMEDVLVAYEVIGVVERTNDDVFAMVCNYLW